MKKILFIYKGRYQVRESATLEWLSAIAQRQRYETVLAYDPDVFGVTDNVLHIPLANWLLDSRERVVKRAFSEAYTYIVFLDSYHQREWNASVAAELKGSLPAKTVLLAYTADQETSAYDHVVTGEPEHVFDHFLQHLGTIAERHIPVDGCAVLDSLPHPDKGLFSKHIDFTNSYMVHVGKGCAYDCSYCQESIYKEYIGKEYVRMRSPQRIIDELVRGYRQYAYKEVIFKDSVFTFNKRWLKEFLELYQEKIGVPYKCFAKVHGFDHEIASLLKESGCYCVEFGVQSFNEELKSRVLNRKESTAVIQAACSQCDRVGLRYDLDYLFGIPGETVSDHLKAAELFSAMPGLNRVKCHNLVVYPDAPLARHMMQKDIDNTTDFFSYTAGEGEMKRYNNAFQKYFKLLPLVPQGIAARFNKQGWWKVCAFIPSIVIMFLQMVYGILTADRRFSIYMRQYPKKLIKAVTV